MLREVVQRTGCTFMARLQQRTHGTAFDTITPETFKTLGCIFPTPEIAAAFDKPVEPPPGQIRASLHLSRPSPPCATRCC